MWSGEENFKRYFGLRGFKCLCVMLKEEINNVRAQVGLPTYTWQQILSRMDTLMEQHKNDDAPDVLP